MRKGRQEANLVMGGWTRGVGGERSPKKNDCGKGKRVGRGREGNEKRERGEGEREKGANKPGGERKKQKAERKGKGKGKSNIEKFF